MKHAKPSTKITRFGYVVDKRTLTEEQLKETRRELTVIPKKMGNFGKATMSKGFPVYVNSGNYLGIPKYFGIEKFGKPDTNRLETYDFPTYDMEYLGKMRPNQEIIVNKVFDGFESQRGGVLVAGCGSGKTNMAIYIACKYKLKTLFVVHKTFLKNQVIERIKSTTNITRVGVIQQKKCEVEYPFIVGMVQSLAKIKYDDSLFKDIGMVIIDEVHHMGAPNFARLYRRISGKYMLGITAEKTRNDGTYKIINWYMGPFLHVEEQKPNDSVVVKRFFYDSVDEKRTKVLYNRDGEINKPKMITNLVEIDSRNQFIMNIIMSLFDEGKNILVLSGRLAQIKHFYKTLRKDRSTRPNVGCYIGGMKEADLAKSATRQIILGSFEMASEGLDIEALNAVILCTPKSAIKQSVGRILRKEVYEEHPLVIDISDKISSFTGQSNTRLKYYESKKYKIQNFTVTDNCATKKGDTIMYDDTEKIKLALQSVPEVSEVTRTEEPDTDVVVDFYDSSDE